MSDRTQSQYDKLTATLAPLPISDSVSVIKDFYLVSERCLSCQSAVTSATADIFRTFLTVSNRFIVAINQ